MLCVLFVLCVVTTVFLCCRAWLKMSASELVPTEVASQTEADALQDLLGEVQVDHELEQQELLGEPIDNEQVVQIESGDAYHRAELAQNASADPSMQIVSAEKPPAPSGVQYKLFRFFQPDKDDGKPAVQIVPKVGRPQKPANPVAKEELQKIVQEQAKQIQQCEHRQRGWAIDQDKIKV